MAGKFIRQASLGKRFVSAAALATFCGTAISLWLAVPMVRFYTCGLYTCLKYAQRERGIGRALVRLSGAAKKELKFWRKFGPEGRMMQPAEPDCYIHSDAANLGWGGTIGRGKEALAEGQGVHRVWSA